MDDLQALYEKEFWVKEPEACRGIVIERRSFANLSETVRFSENMSGAACPNGRCRKKILPGNIFSRMQQCVRILILLSLVEVN